METIMINEQKQRAIERYPLKMRAIGDLGRAVLGEFESTLKMNFNFEYDSARRAIKNGLEEGESFAKIEGQVLAKYNGEGADAKDSQTSKEELIEEIERFIRCKAIFMIKEWSYYDESTKSFNDWSEGELIFSNKKRENTPQKQVELVMDHIVVVCRDLLTTQRYLGCKKALGEHTK